MCPRRMAVAHRQIPIAGFKSAHHPGLCRHRRALFHRYHPRHYFGRLDRKPAWVHLELDTALDEKYATRGRARLRFEMMPGGTIRNGWTGNRDLTRRR